MRAYKILDFDDGKLRSLLRIDDKIDVIYDPKADKIRPQIPSSYLFVLKNERDINGWLCSAFWQAWEVEVPYISEFRKMLLSPLTHTTVNDFWKGNSPAAYTCNVEWYGVPYVQLVKRIA